MNTYFLAITLVVFASFFQGTFGLGMKYMGVHRQANGKTQKHLLKYCWAV